MPQYLRSAENQFQSEELTIGWSWRLLIFSMIVFGAVAILYGGMFFGYDPYLQEKLDALDKETKSLNEAVSIEDQKKLLSFYSQVYNVQDILANHVLPTRVFAFLELNTNPQVAYESMHFDLDSGVLELSGKAKSYDDLVRQLEAFRRQTDIVKVLKLTNSKSGELDEKTNQKSDVVSFGITINVDKGFLKPKK